MEETPTAAITVYSLFGNFEKLKANNVFILNNNIAIM